MKLAIKVFGFAILLLTMQVGFASNQIKNVRIWVAPENTRLVFDLNQKVSYKMSTLTNPNRVVIDFKNCKLQAALNKVDLKNTHIKKLRSGVHANNTLRVVLDLDWAVNPKAFFLNPTGQYGHRLVIELESNQKEAILKLFDLDVHDKIPQPEDFIIAIDPGHGGEDPGAIGPKGTKEKDVALAIAKKLKDSINKHKGFQAFLIRNGDYYLGFRERMNRARSKNADLFISIHADSFVNKKATGASVFVLSSNKSSSVAARWLVKSENRADLVGGVSIKEDPNGLATVIFDLTQTASAAASMEAANHVLKALGTATNLHKNKVESGAFLVLRSPDIPSMLVEAGFLSNPVTEAKLKDPKYQQNIANAISLGVTEHFKRKTRRLVMKQ